MFNPDNYAPAVDPAEQDSLMGTFKTVLRKYTQFIDGCMPAKVLSFDRTLNTVTVQPCIDLISENGTNIVRAPINGLPVYQIGGGGFILNFNLNEGDNGWIIAGDRDTSNYLSSNSTARPETFELKKYSFGFFLPNPLTGYTISDDDASNAVFQSFDGSVKISLGSSGVIITAPSVQVISTSGDTIINSSGNVAVNAGGNASVMATGEASISAASLSGAITGACTITTPLLRVVGNINASGTITPLVP